MITTITRYPSSYAERFVAIAGGLAATLLLALGAFGLMDKPDSSEGHAVAAGTVIVIIGQRGAGE